MPRRPNLLRALLVFALVAASGAVVGVAYAATGTTVALRRPSRTLRARRPLPAPPSRTDRPGGRAGDAIQDIGPRRILHRVARLPLRAAHRRLDRPGDGRDRPRRHRARNPGAVCRNPIATGQR